MCAVIGIADEQWGERVHAVVLPKVGQSVSGAGKVLKTVLRAQHAEQRA
jgi:acyl-CoA synthetase (AMP-forming)/AMP-acid ligase II